MLRPLIAFATIMALAASAKAADPARGHELFAQCVACHSLDGSNGVGPSLKGVIGRRAGTLADFRYSPSMRRVGLVWDEATLDSYIKDPQAIVRGTRMPFSGMEDARDRADLVAFLSAAWAP